MLDSLYELDFLPPGDKRMSDEAWVNAYYLALGTITDEIEDGNIINLEKIRLQAVWYADRWTRKVPKPGEPGWEEHVKKAQGHEDDMRLYHSVYEAIKKAIESPEGEETTPIYIFLAEKLKDGLLDKIVVEDLLEIVNLLAISFQKQNMWSEIFEQWLNKIELE